MKKLNKTDIKKLTDLAFEMKNISKLIMNFNVTIGEGISISISVFVYSATKRIYSKIINNKFELINMMKDANKLMELKRYRRLK